MQENQTILVIDDEEMLLELLSSFLTSSGYSVLTATDGEEAVRIFQAHLHEIALIITDMGLANESGIELFAKLRQLKPSVRGILASGYLKASTAAEMNAAGLAASVEKPFDTKVLVRTIRETLDAA